MAVRYCIQLILENVQAELIANTRGITNYEALFDDIRSPSSTHGEPVCFVTFNYDRLLEYALESFGIKIGRLDDYTASPLFKLFKAHGSVDGIRIVLPQGGFDPDSFNCAK